jgi:hypothetical protein
VLHLNIRFVLLASPVFLALGAQQAHPARVLPLPEVDTPSGGGGSVVLEPVSERAVPSRRRVFSCVSPGLVTFSDRPCGPSPDVRELKLDAPGPPPSGGAPTVEKHKDAPGPRTTAKEHDDEEPANTAMKHTEKCRKLEAAVAAIDSRMRSGYSAREAGRLWDRWREAKARLQEADC